MILHTLVGRCTTKLQKQNTLEFGRLYTKRFPYCCGLFVCLFKCVVFYFSLHLCFCVRDGLPFPCISQVQLHMLIILEH